MLDLQAGFARCYDQCGYGQQVDYSSEPPVSLDDTDRRWLHELLKQLKLRT